MAKKRRKHRHKGLLFPIFVLIILIGVISVQISNLYAQNEKLEDQVNKIEQEIFLEKHRQFELLKKKQFINSDQYIEQLAREKFGLVKPGEILFVKPDK